MKLGSTVVKPAVIRMLADRRRREERSLSLAELINRKATDTFTSRKANRGIEALTDMVAERLAPLCRSELSDLDEAEREAALTAVLATFDTVDLSDNTILKKADADPVKLVQLVRSSLPDVADRAALSDSGRRLYDVVLDEVCVSFANLVVHLPSFQPRATAELLSRISGLADHVAQIYARLPVRTLDAPTGTADDEEFQGRYLRLISNTLDEIELFGVDVRHYRPRTTLSVAYISLAVSTEPASRRRARWQSWDPGLLRHHDWEAMHDAGAVRVESALSRASRLLIRGDAGSGKSTLFRWLAITAARRKFAAELADWNGFVPFLIKLRNYAGTTLPRPEQFLDRIADPISGQMPASWVHRVLASGKALLMVDGVDELPKGERHGVRDWLRGLLATYPDVIVVVTSRPTPGAGQWLPADGFATAELERMSPTDVRKLITHWHEAIRDAGDLPCDESELPRYESALLARLDSTSPLQALATTPLLCAMLCALNLDRNTQLPTDRIGIYQAAVDLLLERRDAQRQIPGTDVGLNTQDKLQLLQDLAWWLTINGRTELSREQALQCLSKKLSGMSRVEMDEYAALEHLLTRSGVIGEPVPDRLEFVHRTFQEYLAARECAEHNHVGVLIDHAHLDTWRETIVLATGHGNAPFRTELLTGLLRRADVSPRYARQLRVLAASCLETAPTVKPELLNRIHQELDTLIPPRKRVEARSLATIGNPLLRALPRDLTEVTGIQAAACVRAAALVNGPKALGLLAVYAPDPRPEVQRELAACWEFFDPVEYADRVLAGAPLDNGRIEVRRVSLLRAINRLTKLTALDLTLRYGDNPRLMLEAPKLARLTWVCVGYNESNISAVLRNAFCRDSIESVSLYKSGAVLNASRILERLHSNGLKALFLSGFRFDTIEFVARFPDLYDLDLDSVAEVSNFAPLSNLAKLCSLSLCECTNPSGLDELCGIPNLYNLHLAEARSLKVINTIVRLWQLRLLGLYRCGWLSDLQPISALPNLENLLISHTPISDLKPLARLPKLTYLDVSLCDSLTDLSPLADCSHLKHVNIHNHHTRLDVSPLAHRRIEIYACRDQHLVGLDKISPKAKVIRYRYHANKYR